MRTARIFITTTVALLTLVAIAATATAGEMHGGTTDFSAYEWREVNDNAAWTPRAGLQVVEHGGNLYLLGGRTPRPPSLTPIPGDSDIWGDVWKSMDRGASWVRILETDDSSHWPARAYFRALKKGPFVYVLGGQNFKLIPNPDPTGPPFISTSDFFNDVWRSRDGVNWKQMTDEAGWQGRAGLSSVEFNGRIYVMGGSFNDDPAVIGGPPTRVYFNDVWSSRDGRHWKLETANAPWAPRAGAIVVVKDGYMYLLGGEDGFLCLPGSPCPPYYNDVWRSKDGDHWERVTESAEWAPRPGHQAAVIQNQIVLFGGFGLSTDPTNPFAAANPMDIWVSKDGASWEQVSESPWNATSPEDIKYDFAAVVASGGAGGLRPSILTFGGDRETFDFADPTNFMNVDNDVWEYYLPKNAGGNGNGWGRLHRERMEIGRALIEVQSPNWPSVLPYYTDDIEYHDPIVDIYGIDSMSQFLGRLFGSTPDLVTTIETETLVDGVYTAAWTMVGQFTGVPYRAKGISIIKFRGSSKQVYYQRDYYTEGDIMISIPGLDEAAAGFRTFYRCAVDPTFDCPIEPPATDALSMPKPIKESPLIRGRGSGGSYAKRMEIGRSLVDVRAESFQSVLPYFDEDFEYHDPIIDIYGADAMARFLGRFFGSDPTLVTTIEDETLDKDVYAATWTMNGQFNGVPYSAKGMSIVKFGAGTRVIYQRDYYTEGDIMLSIPGLDEAAAGFRDYYRCAVDPTFDCPIEPPTVLAGPEAADTGQDTPKSAATFALQQNIPNPFNPVTTISFEVPNGTTNVSLRVYDVSGRLVKTLVDGDELSGTVAVGWDGTNDQGRPVASGTYFYRLTTPSFSETKKMVLLK